MNPQSHKLRYHNGCLEVNFLRPYFLKFEERKICYPCNANFLANLYINDGPSLSGVPFPKF